ncbi:hypothetical protein KFK09_002763 [Dendrobium nobile]|uniref:Uncharacterized protein n=1 Tax=Dendrobium nobile TaxID=94219 RepID=A0A8T3C2K0_DENNO|nr:hypothetical protein KFK09_002763 [Dendrobium nobile]
MPSSRWKKAISADGLLSGLRSKSSGSLVVQTGFPTSLADLIVKNHGRLKKSSRSNKKKPSPSSEVPRLPAPEYRSAAPVIENPRSADRSMNARPGIQFLIVNLILLVALVIGKKKLVVGITISAFTLFILEIFGRRGWRFLKPCPEARKRLDSLIWSFDLGGRDWASPIREIDAGLRVDLSVSGGTAEESKIKDPSSELLPESCDFGKVCSKRKLGSSGDSKAKKLLKKFVLRKFHGIREPEKVPHCVEATEEKPCETDLLEKQEEESDSDDEAGSFKTCYGDLGDGDDTHRTKINVGENKSGRIYEFVFFFIVLCGLVRGKLIALLLAMVWCFLYKFIMVVRSKRRMR